MYEIIIKKKEIVTKMCRGTWKTVDEKPLSKDDCKNIYYDDPGAYRDKLKRVFAYTPDRKSEVEVETELLKQTVEKLDLASVIKAINNL